MDNSQPVSSMLQAVRNVIAPGLWLLFCGINPGTYSGVTGHHFARPGNRFWPTLFRSGFTDRQLAPAEEWQLLDYGLGITNIAPRVTTAAAELTASELQDGGQALVGKVQHYQPRVLAVLGISAYRTAFQQPRATIGRQASVIGETLIWVLPNPSGLNAHYTPADLAVVFADCRQAVLTEIGPYRYD